MKEIFCIDFLQFPFGIVAVTVVRIINEDGHVCRQHIIDKNTICYN